MTIADFSKQINILKKEGRLDDALLYFKTHRGEFSIEQIGQNPYLVAGMITILRKRGYIDETFKFIEMFNVKIDENVDGVVLNAYGWLVFDKYKKDTKNGQFNAIGFMHSVAPMVTTIMQRHDVFFDTLIHYLFDTVLRTEKAKTVVNYKFLNDFCDLFLPDRLSTKPETMEIEKRGRIQRVELASDREKWYAIKTKALLELGDAEQCLILSREALEIFDVFHNNNDVWFARRIALSHKIMGEIGRAIDELEDIGKKKNDWFIKRELAELYFETENFEKAFELSMQAMNEYGDVEYKIGVMELIAKLLLRKGEEELAYKHLLLVKTIREKNGWKIPDELHSKIASLNVALTIDEPEKLRKELLSYWKQFKPRVQRKPSTGEKKSGKIKKILHQNEQGVDGFIEAEDGDYYFSLPASVPISSNLGEGITVVFEGKEELKGKRARKLQMAL